MIKNSKNKNLYKIYQKTNPNFNLKVAKKSIDTIKTLYGLENIYFQSFIKYFLHKRSSIVIHKDTMHKELDDIEANHISEKLNKLGNYLIIPESLKILDEEKQYEKAIKTSGKYITHIMEKAGIDFDKMLYYIDLQVVTHEINEKVIDYYTFEKIFHLIYFLSIKLKNKDKMDIAFYSFRQILKNCGIKLEEILPYLHIDIKNINRKINNIDEIPLYKGVQKRLVKELVSSEMYKNNFDIKKGNDSFEKIDKINFDDLELFRNKESNLLNDLINRINKKKEEIKKVCDEENNQIFEIKNNENNIFYISKINYDKLIKSKEDNDKNNNNELKIKDINNNNIDITYLDLKEGENINIKKPYIKIFNKTNKKEPILILKDDLYNKLNDFKYIRQKDKFFGKDIKGETKEIEGLFMDLKCGNLSEKDEENDKLPTVDNFIKYDKRKDEYNIDPEYENIINPYNNIPFRQIINNNKEEIKNEDNKGERKTYRIRRAILFKKPPNEKEKENESN